MSANVIASGTHGWSASRRTNIDRLMRSARRHSLLVRFVRVALPVGLALGVVAVAAFNYFDPLRILNQLPRVTGKLTVSGSKITMEVPKIVGFTRDNRPYEMTASTAIQDITNPDIIDLKDVRATIQMPGENVLDIAAQNGVYNTKADQIILRDQVEIATTGFFGRMREAAIDMKNGRVVSELPVEVTLPDGVIKANRLEVLESGELIRFDRGVVVTLDGETPAGAKK